MFVTTPATSRALMHACLGGYNNAVHLCTVTAVNESGGSARPAKTSRGDTPEITLGCDKSFLKNREELQNPFPIDSSMFGHGSGRRSKAILASGAINYVILKEGRNLLRLF